MDSNISATLEAGRGNCSPYISALRCSPASQKDKHKDRKKFKKIKFTEIIQKAMIKRSSVNLCINCICKSFCAEKSYLFCTARYWQRTVANILRSC